MRFLSSEVHNMVPWNPAFLSVQYNLPVPIRQLVYRPYQYKHTWKILAKRSMFVETGNIDPEALYATDYDYWLRFAAVARIGYYDDFNVMSRRHSEQGSCIGENEIYAAKAFENMTRKKELMERLCKKAGYAYTRETIVQAYLSRMINAQGKEKELLVLTRALEAYLTEKGTV